MKNILLISPTWVNIHEDIQHALELMGFTVTFIPEYSFPEDPYRIKGKRVYVTSEHAESMKIAYWDRMLEGSSNRFDFLIVIDGQGVCTYLTDKLRLANPSIYCVNYLYDTTSSVYHFEMNFCVFDKIYTFDRGESSKYDIELLPIYWTPAVANSNTPRYDVFGFGAYSKNRFELYKFINDIAIRLDKKCFLKTYHKVISHQWIHFLKNIFRILTFKSQFISLNEYNSDLISHDLISTTDFRRIIQSSEIVVDTKVLNQDGLTARFMWALGAEKKIITTNEAAKKYAFYSDDQILILDENKHLESQKDEVIAFMKNKFVMSEECRLEVQNYRLDKWVSKLLNIKQIS